MITLPCTETHLYNTFISIILHRPYLRSRSYRVHTWFIRRSISTKLYAECWLVLIWVTTVWTNILHRELGEWNTANVELYEEIILGGGGGKNIRATLWPVEFLPWGILPEVQVLAWVSRAANELNTLHRSVQDCKAVFEDYILKLLVNELKIK